MMAYVVETVYRQAMAYYNIANEAGYCVARLLSYSGTDENRPPAHFIVINSPTEHHFLYNKNLPEDINRALAAPQKSENADPLFPHKHNRFNIVDQLV